MIHKQTDRMNSIVLLFIFFGAILVIVGLYEEKLKIAQQDKKIEYRFIPRTYYEEQMSYDNLFDKVGSMFDDPDPWQERVLHDDEKLNHPSQEKKKI